MTPRDLHTVSNQSQVFSFPLTIDQDVDPFFVRFNHILELYSLVSTHVALGYAIAQEDLLAIPSLVLMSACTGIMLPGPWDGAAVLAASWRGSSRRPVMYTLQPFCARAPAVINPRPVPPPVTLDLLASG